MTIFKLASLYMGDVSTYLNYISKITKLKIILLFEIIIQISKNDLN